MARRKTEYWTSCPSVLHAVTLQSTFTQSTVITSPKWQICIHGNSRVQVKSTFTQNTVLFFFGTTLGIHGLDHKEIMPKVLLHNTVITFPNMTHAYIDWNLQANAKVISQQALSFSFDIHELEHKQSCQKHSDDNEIHDTSLYTCVSHIKARKLGARMVLLTCPKLNSWTILSQELHPCSWDISSLLSSSLWFLSSGV